jgi:hypothetical protein
MPDDNEGQWCLGLQGTTHYIIPYVFYQWIIVLDGALYLACEDLTSALRQYNQPKSVVLDQLQKWPLVPDAGRREVIEYYRFERYLLPGSDQQHHIVTEGRFRVFAD